MSDLQDENYYLNEIFSFLKDIEGSKAILPDDDEKLKENKINILSEDLFEDLYYNLLYYYKSNGNKKIESNEQKSLYKSLYELLSIIYESDITSFRNSKVKLTLVYLIDFFRESKLINLEIVCNVIYNLKDIFSYITNNRIEDIICKFEVDAYKIAKQCCIVFIGDSNVEIENFDKLDSFGKIMHAIQKLCNVTIPFHLKGFIDYYEMPNKIKPLIIKIYNYIDEINPFKKEKETNNKYNLYQGYSLYEILVNFNEKRDKIDIPDFYELKKNRIIDINAKAILELSLKLLRSKSKEDLEKVLINVNINSKVEIPKISNNFNNTKEYYKDLYNQLQYYIMEYKNNPKKKICKIIYEDFYRVLWLNFIKQLLLNITEKKLEKNHIKIIFYFIVNLFSPDIDTESALEFRIDTIPILYSQCDIRDFLLNNEYIFQILDKDYLDCYTLSENKIKYNQKIINIIDKQIIQDKELIDVRKKNIYMNCEITHILDCSPYLPLPLLKHYVQQEVILVFKKSDISLSNFLQNCFCDLGSLIPETFINSIKTMNFKVLKEEEKEDLIEQILKEQDFQDLLKEIMKSNVMKNAYLIMNKFYFSNGKFNQDEEMNIIKNNKIIDLEKIEKETFEKVKNIKNTNKEKISQENELNNNEIINNDTNNNKIIEESEFNFINDKPIISYYNKFCKQLDNFDYSNIFIIMGLPKTIKGFTFRFLKIVINTNGIILNMDDNSKIILLKAYLIFILIHEQNHFIKRYFNINYGVHLCDTPNINGYDEGGRHLIKLLFGDEMIHKNINIEQAKYILDKNNWANKSIYEFKSDFKKIKIGGTKDTIVYLTSEYSSTCDHSKLHI